MIYGTRIKKVGPVMKNNIRIFGDLAVIELRKKNGNHKYCIIDVEDVDLVKYYRWCDKRNYVKCKLDKQYKQIHRIIMEPDNNMVVDHINHDTLDNRKCNLRIVTIQQNNMNVRKRKDNTSGIVGVCWDKAHRKWQSEIKLNNKKIKLGRFNTFEEAVEKRKEAEIEYFGEYRYKE